MNQNKEIAAIRAYTVPVSKKKKNSGDLETSDISVPVFDRILVFDTETRTDLYQNMTFGYFTIYDNKRVDISGIFFDPNIVTSKEKKILDEFSKTDSVELWTLDEFRELFLKEVFDLQTLCVGFNLPFDISRIALDVTEGKKGNLGAFSFIMSNKLHYPRLVIKHISSTMSFINWGSTIDEQKPYFRKDTNYFKGNFLDLRMLVHALTNEKHTLKSACKKFNTKYKKQETEEYGKVTAEHIKYCVSDVNATFSLYQNTKKEFDRYNLDIPITKAFSPAAIGKAFLNMMDVKSFKEKNTTKDFPNKIIGNIMTAYFGGRTECKIRRTPVMVDLLDFLSMYPTVCTLQNLWRFVIADHIEYRDATSEVTKFVDEFALEDLQNKENWKKLQAIVEVQPDDDVLPLRAQYGERHAWNIGLVYLKSKVPLWYSLADVIASKLYTGKTPKILKVIKFEAGNPEPNLRPINIHGIDIDPYSQDLFQELIKYRQHLKQEQEKYPKDSKEYDYYEDQRTIIKIIANSISYGIFVEINPSDKRALVDIYGLVNFLQKKDKIEKPGFMFNPIIAVSITSASRLLLAASEVLLSRLGGTHAYCDTDSMAVDPKYTKALQDFFQPLNPYGTNDEVFKLEKSRMWFYGISAKRYCLYSIDDNTGEITIDKKKSSSHGLGHLLNPLSNYDEKNSEEKTNWHMEVWKDILDLEYGKINTSELNEKYQDKYALQKLAISTPIVLNRIKQFNEGQDYYHKIKPSNFCIVGFGNKEDEETGEMIKPIAPNITPAKLAVFDDCIDYNNQKKRDKKFRGKEYWKPITDTIIKYITNPESKFDGDNGVLERKHVVVTDIAHIGKESDAMNEPFGLDEFSYEFYDDPERVDREFKENMEKILALEPKDVKDIGINRTSLWNVKNHIKNVEYDKISDKIKIKILSVLNYD